MFSKFKMLVQAVTAPQQCEDNNCYCGCCCLQSVSKCAIQKFQNIFQFFQNFRVFSFEQHIVIEIMQAESCISQYRSMDVEKRLGVGADHNNTKIVCALVIMIIMSGLRTFLFLTQQFYLYLHTYLHLSRLFCWARSSVIYE